MGWTRSTPTPLGALHERANERRPPQRGASGNRSPKRPDLGRTPARRHARAGRDVPDDERIWPKVYVRGSDDLLGIFVEISVDLTGGVTDAQLIQHLTCAVATSGLAFKAIGDTFGVPDQP